MKKYIQQLLEELESIILKRWRQCPPHYFQAGIPDPYLVPPKGWEEDGDGHLSDVDNPMQVERSLAEMERWLDEPEEDSMFAQFGLIPEQFPPVDWLSDEQLDSLVEAIRRLWAAFNFSAAAPRGVPGRVLYGILLKRMLEACTVMDFGHIGIEFCDYNPEQCPFGKEYCDCKEYF